MLKRDRSGSDGSAFFVWIEIPHTHLSLFASPKTFNLGFISNRMGKVKTLRLRCWIDVNGKKFFGPGPAQLLLLIEECGSVAEAAKQMKMSYKKAWDLVDNINSQAQKPFVILKKGGEKGGGAALTATGKKVISEYQLLTRKLNKIMDSHQRILKMI